MGFFDEDEQDSPRQEYKHDSSKVLNEKPGWTRKKGIPKFMPVQKEGDELFDEVYQIREGPKFQEQCGREADSNIHIIGGDGSHPVVESFAACNFSEEIQNNLKLLKYSQPLPIQKSVIPLIQYKDSDIIGHARTGSGKTLAFMLPIVNEIQLYKELRNVGKNQGKPLAMLIAPTKELAQQLCDGIRAFARGTNVDVFVSYGEMPFVSNCRQIKTSGCDIFVATCGRAHHFINDEIVKLDDLRYFVLDEADQLLEETFFEEIRRMKYSKRMNPNHRTFMFSATFDAETQRKFEELVKPDYFFVGVGDINQAVETVQQQFIKVLRYEKFDTLVDLLLMLAKPIKNKDQLTLFDIEKTIIFVQHRRQADRIAIALAMEGFKVISSNGDRTLQQRIDAAEKFIRGVYQILVATNVAARGLNYPNIQHVINYDLPEYDLLFYIHRIGRCGRAGNVGRATSFFDPEREEDRQYAHFYVKILKDVGQEVPKFLEDIAAEEEAKRMMQEYDYFND